MNKRLLTLMAIVMALGMVLMAGPVWADAGNVGGDVPTIRVIDSVSVDSTMTGTYFSAVAVGDYDTGYKESGTNGSTVTVTANTAWEVTVLAGVTGDYFTASPVGLGDVARTVNQKPLSDLLIKVSNINEGSDSNSSTPAVENAFDSYKALTFAAQDLVNSASGNDSASWDVQFKMLLDGSKDTPGTYTANITYTVQADD